MLNSRLIEKYIEKADSVIKDYNNKTTDIFKDGKIKKVYKSYVAAFGPTVVQMGLLPALAFYLSESGSSEGKRSLVIDMIARVIEEKLKEIDGSEKNDKGNTTEMGRKLYDRVLALYKGKKHSEIYQLRSHIESAVIALKLVMRTYPDDKTEGAEPVGS